MRLLVPPASATARGLGQSGRLAGTRRAPQTRDVWRRRPIVEREDVDAMFGALFDIRRDVRAIRHLLEDDGEEEEEETDPEL